MLICMKERVSVWNTDPSIGNEDACKTLNTWFVVCICICLGKYLAFIESVLVALCEETVSAWMSLLS